MVATIMSVLNALISGEIPNFTGVSDPYEEPLNPEVIVETDKESVEESVAKILSALEAHGYIPAATAVCHHTGDEAIYPFPCAASDARRAR